jgi:predicted nucleic-acid-binding protein
MLIGVDTNVLARIFLEDHPQQQTSAHDFLSEMASKNRLFISSYVILELVWVLDINDKSKHQIIESVEAILDIQGVIIDQRSVILVALEKYITGKADFGDYMIVASGEENHVHLLATFDKSLAKDSSKNYMSPDKFSQKP